MQKMRVDIEKRYMGSYGRIAREANKSIKRVNLKIQKGKYQKLLSRKDISAETKKKKLARSLHELIINTFSVNINKIKNKKRTIDCLKANIALIREIIHKIKAINNYLEEGLLRELGIIKSSLIVKAVKSGRPVRYLEKSGRVLSKDYIDRIEHTVYELLQKIIFFDKKLLKDYKKREIKIISKEKVGIKDLENILKIESELLDALEAKIPPANKVKTKLFRKEVFSSWVPMVFALLSSFETEYGKEVLIFSKIKKNNKLRKKIEKKIKHIANEKEKLLKMKEKRVLSMKGLGKISDDYRQTFHDYVSVASL
jgi:hypothetical protein|tara:strand:+ start:5575 stop:6510 length:936 start_codon:yes stop_codon:yes gene_type:complete